MADFDVENSELFKATAILVDSKLVDNYQNVLDMQPPDKSEVTLERETMMRRMRKADVCVGFSWVGGDKNNNTHYLSKECVSSMKDESVDEIIMEIRQEIDIVRGKIHDPIPLRVMMNKVVSICQRKDINGVDDILQECKRVYPRFGFYSSDVTFGEPFRDTVMRGPSKNVCLYHVDDVVVRIDFFHV